MKASELLELYRNGERDFRRLNLRGANLSGQNLSGADFSYSDIRGANFRNTNLTNAKFIGIKAGLTQYRVMYLTVFLCLVAVVPQYFLLQAFKFPIYLTDNINPRINLTALILSLMIYGYSFLKNFLSEKIPIIISTHFIILVFITNLSFLGIRFIQLENYIFLGLTTCLIILVSAICTSVYYAIHEHWKFYILIILSAFLGLIRGYLVSQETEVVMIISSLFSTIGWIAGSIIGYWGLQEKENYQWVYSISLIITSLLGTTFKEAILIDADLTMATLENTNFNQALLTRTCFKDTVKLNLARAGKTILANHIVRDLLINPSSGFNLNLFKANLRGANLDNANLQEANLTQADLSEASFTCANFREANLTEVNAVKANFSHVTLTGACLENWNIDATTNLENVDCQYVYLLNNQQERRPSSGDFQGDEFTKLFEEVFDTVDLIFRDGIDWKAFLLAIKEVQVQNEDTPLQVQSIENKGDGVVVVKVKVPPDADKEKIHQDFNEVYQLKLEAVKAKYKAQLEAKEEMLKDKEETIADYRQTNSDMMKTIQYLSQRPINVIAEAKAMTNSSDSSRKIDASGNMTISDSVVNLGDIIGDVNNTINQISEETSENKQLKALFQELMAAIQNESELDDEEKEDAAKNVEKIAKAGKTPNDEGMQKKAKRAVSLLETLAGGLEPASKLCQACQTIMPQIKSILPFLA